MSAAPQSQPVPPAPKVAEPKRSRAWMWLVGVAVLAGGGYAAWRMNPAPVAAVAAVPTVKAVRGNLDVRLRVTGQTTAERFANISAPKLNGPEADRPLVLTKLIDHGVMVKRGQLLAEIDSSGMKDHMDDVSSQVLQAGADIDKRRAEQAVEVEALSQTLRVAKADVDKAALDLRTAELKTTVDRELLQLAVDEANARFTQLSKDVVSKARVHEAEIATLEFTKRRHERHFQRHEVDLSRFTMNSPIDGRAVIQQVFSGDSLRLVRLGDRVFSAMVFLKVVDPKSLVLEGSVSQGDSARLELGQKADLSFDAYPSLRLTGEVSMIGAIATRSWRQQYYIRNIRMAVKPAELNERVISDLSGAADITLATHENQILVPRSAIYNEGDQAFVRVRSGTSFTKRSIQVGPSNSMYVAVTKGLSVGEEVALTAPVVDPAAPPTDGSPVQRASN